MRRPETVEKVHNHAEYLVTPISVGDGVLDIPSA